MSNAGAPKTPAIDASGLKIAVVASSWHETIMDGLISGASNYLNNCNASFEIFRVPGSFELPLGVKIALANEFDGAVALGLVLRGDTPHFDYVCDGVTSGLMQLMLDTGKPVGFGLLTCDTEEQAIARSGLKDMKSNKGLEAAHATVEMSLLKKKLS